MKLIPCQLSSSGLKFKASFWIGLTVAALNIGSADCLGAPVPWSIDNKPVEPVAESIQVSSNSMALSPTPTVPYELRFEALVPSASTGSPDDGTPQKWNPVSEKR